MPTGYTEPVRSGKVTEFKDFALRCARAFGTLIELRDEPMDAPLPAKIKPSTYHETALATAKEHLAALRAMTPARAEREAEKAHKKLMEAHEAYEAEKKVQEERCLQRFASGRRRPKSMSD